MLKIFTSKRKKDDGENWVFVSELDKILNNEIEEGKTNIVLFGANLIADVGLILPNDKYHVIVYHCRFKGDSNE